MKCRYCKEEIKRGATACKHCNRSWDNKADLANFSVIAGVFISAIGAAISGYQAWSAAKERILAAAALNKAQLAWDAAGRALTEAEAVSSDIRDINDYSELQHYEHILKKLNECVDAKLQANGRFPGDLTKEETPCHMEFRNAQGVLDYLKDDERLRISSDRTKKKVCDEIDFQVTWFSLNGDEFYDRYYQDFKAKYASECSEYFSVSVTQ